MVGKIIVVGKNSYIGSYFTNYLRSRQRDFVSLSSKECNFLNRDEVLRFFESLGSDPHIVVFLAVIGKSSSNKFQDYIDNIRLVKNLVDAQQVANTRSVIYMSSVDVYGRSPRLPITEESRLRPDTWYGLAKQTCEWMLLTSGEVKCPVTALRIPGIYGRWDRDKSVIGKLISSIRSEGRVNLSGDGTVRRDYVYVDDLCRLMTLLIAGEQHGILNVATGSARSLLEIVGCIRQVMHNSFDVIHQPVSDERAFDLVFDTTQLESVLPEFRFSDMEVGIRTYLD